MNIEEYFEGFVKHKKRGKGKKCAKGGEHDFVEFKNRKYAHLKSWYEWREDLFGGESKGTDYKCTKCGREKREHEYRNGKNI